MTDTSGPSVADYQQAMDDAVAVLLAETGIPREVWDGWTQSAAEWYGWLEQRNAAMPRRVAAECGAKRRILARHAPRVAVEGPHEGELICGCSDGVDEFLATPWPCADVRDLTSVFADRPGYLPEWRP